MKKYHGEKKVTVAYRVLHYRVYYKEPKKKKSAVKVNMKSTITEESYERIMKSGKILEEKKKKKKEIKQPPQ